MLWVSKSEDNQSKSKLQTPLTYCIHTAGLIMNLDLEQCCISDHESHLISHDSYDSWHIIIISYHMSNNVNSILNKNRKTQSCAKQKHHWSRIMNHTVQRAPETQSWTLLWKLDTSDTSAEQTPIPYTAVYVLSDTNTLSGFLCSCYSLNNLA